MTATATASTTVPITANTNRRMADQIPARRACRRAGRNRAAEPSGAATILASSIAWSIRPFTDRALRAIILGRLSYPPRRSPIMVIP